MNSANGTNRSGFGISFDAESLKPIIEQTITAVLAKIESQRSAMNEQLAFGEAQAAQLLGLKVHQLRDERLRGRIGHVKGVGGRIFYQREHLLTYLAERRVEPGEA